VGIFFFVRSSNDIWIFFAVFGAFNLLSVLIEYASILRSHSIAYPSKKGIVLTMKSGFDMYISHISQIVYNNSGVLILGSISTSIVAGLYGGADKVVKVFRQLIDNLISVLFPRSISFRNEREREVKFRNMTLKISIVLSIFLALVIYFLSEVIVNLILGPDFSRSILFLQWLSLTIPLFVVNRILGKLWIVADGGDGYFRNTLVLALPILIVSSYFLYQYFGGVGVVFGYLFAEGFILVRFIKGSSSVS
jgi:polysaccharide transporter, PST family